MTSEQNEQNEQNENIKLLRFMCNQLNYDFDTVYKWIDASFYENGYQYMTVENAHILTINGRVRDYAKKERESKK